MNGQDPQENPNKLFVGNLPWSTTQDQLQELFAQYGEIVDIHLVTDRMSGRSRGIAFVEFATKEEAFTAYQLAKSRLHQFNPTIRERS